MSQSSLGNNAETARRTGLIPCQCYKLSLYDLVNEKQPQATSGKPVSTSQEDMAASKRDWRNRNLASSQSRHTNDLLPPATEDD
jgi:hypothetical protein